MSFTCMARSWTSSWKRSPRATKSVSQLTSTRTPNLRAQHAGVKRCCEFEELMRTAHIAWWIFGHRRALTCPPCSR